VKPEHTRRDRLPLIALLTANAISTTGNVLSMLAIPWFVLVTTGSATQTGVAGFVGALPFIISGIFGGAFVDRLGFKRASVVADIASGVTVALIPLLHFTVGLAFWQLLVLVFLGALLDAPGMNARKSLLPEIAERAGMRLERANAFEQSVGRASMLVGPPLAGLLIAGIGAQHVLWLDAASFVVSALLTAVAVPVIAIARAETRPGVGGYFHDLAEGFRFLRADRLVITLVALVALTNFLDGMMFLALPVYALRVYGSAFDLGLMLAASGGGALAGALVFAAVGHNWPRRATFIAGFVLSGLSMLALPFTPPLLALVAISVVAALGAGPLNPILMTVMQERVPAEMRGRMMGIIMAIAWVAIPAARLLAGFLIDGIGLIPAVSTMAIAYLVVTVGLAGVPVLREMDAPRMPKHSKRTSDRPTVSLAAGGRET
jgi:MFS family permease